MSDKEMLFVSVDGWLVKIQNAVNFLKNILFVTYIKNKGLRRLAFITSCIAVVCCLYGVLLNTSPIDEIYKNLDDMRTDVSVSFQVQAPYWYKKQECAQVFLEKHGLSRMDAMSFLVSESVTHYCELYPKECHLLLAMEDEPIHLKCSGLGNAHFTLFENICIILLILIFVFYLPFIMLCITKFTYNVLKWIYKGFTDREL